MIYSEVFDFIEDLGKCFHAPELPIRDYTYNGINLAQGTDTYEILLQTKFTRFKAAICEMTEEQQRVVLEDLKAIEGQYFDVPDDDVLAEMLRDFERSGTAEFREDITKARFAHDMCCVQRRFIVEAIGFVNRLSSAKDKAVKPELQSEESLPAQTSSNKGWLTVDEVCSRFNLPKNNIKDRQWRLRNGFPKGNSIPCEKLSFDADAVEQWMKDQRKC